MRKVRPNDPSTFTVHISGTHPRPTLTRDDIIAPYDSKLERAKCCARYVASLYALSRHLACGKFLFAVVLVLGEFVDGNPASSAIHLRSPNLSLLLLLVLDWGRLSYVTASSSLLDRSRSIRLRRVASSAVGIVLDLFAAAAKISPRPRLTSFFRLFSYALQIFLIFLLVAIATHLQEAQAPSYSSNDTAVRQSYFFLFYVLVLVNCLVGFAAATANVFAVFLIIPSSTASSGSTPFSDRSAPHEQSLVRYYDHVLQNVTDRMDFFRFAYVDLLGPEFERKVPPGLVCRYYAEMLEYLYAHRSGVDALDVHLDHENPSVREAAANVPGFWLSEDMGLRISPMVTTLPEKVVRKLVKKLGHGQVGFAAANSIRVIAAEKPDIILHHRRTSEKDWPWEDLARAIDPQSMKSMVVVQALVHLVQSEVQEAHLDLLHEWGQVGKDLEEKLWKVLSSTCEMKAHRRFRALSAYALLLLDSTKLSKKLVRSIELVQDEYWLSSEMEMVTRLRSVCEGMKDDEDLEEPKLPSQIRADTDLRPLPLSLRHSETRLSCDGDGLPEMAWRPAMAPGSVRAETQPTKPWFRDGSALPS